MRIKICGINTHSALQSAVQHGADALGFVFFERSPRAVGIDHACDLTTDLPKGVARVALVVNADDALLDDIARDMRPDWIQLHGSESPERCAEIGLRYDVKIMKAMGIASAADLSHITAYINVVDQLLLDAKPPKNAALPGGNGAAFDWAVLQGAKIGLPWLLAGGLTPENVASAIRISDAPGVDVSSGVETAPGQKDPTKIKDFIANAKAALDATGRAA